VKRAAIVAPVRTPVGAFGGAFRSVPAEDLAAVVIRAVVQRSGIDPARIDDVVFSQAYPNSEAPCIGRWAALHAGLPEHIPGLQVDRRCGGGLQAIATAAMMVQTGAAEMVVAGGVESMSGVEYYTTDARWGARFGSTALHDRLERARARAQPEWRYGPISGMVETAENVAERYHITRTASDAYAAESHARAAQAQRRGHFEAEIAAVTVERRGRDPVVVSSDECIRPDTTVDALASLKPLMPHGVVTAGNASQQNDAAAACLIVAEDSLTEFGLEPAAFLVDHVAVGCDPATMGLGPVPAVEKLFRRTGLSFDDMDLVELNEAFACQVLGVAQAWGWNDPDRLNINGSGISLGHPIGATGVRIMTTLLSALARRGGRYGLETMCAGGGQGVAAIFEAP